MPSYVKTTNIPAGLDHSARKLLREKFLLGLFDNPFVDLEAAERVVGNAYFRRIGQETQRRAYTLLTNKNDILPLKPVAHGTRFYIEGFNSTFLTRRGFTVVSSPEEADYALLRLSSPTTKRPGSGGFSSRLDWGPLEFNATEQARQKSIYDAVPTIVDVRFIRPAAIPEIADSASALLVAMAVRRTLFSTSFLVLQSRRASCLLTYRGVHPRLQVLWRMCRSIRGNLCSSLDMG